MPAIRIGSQGTCDGLRRQDDRPNEEAIMFLDTTRFGKIEVEDDRLITFPNGLLGFGSYKQFVMFEQTDESYFWWLQSVDAPDLAFVVTDPSMFVPTYRVPMKQEQMQEIGLDSFDNAQVLVIVNKHKNMLTGNLQGPLVINVITRQGAQMVLSDRRFTTRVPLVEMPTPIEAMSA